VTKQTFIKMNNYLNQNPIARQFALEAYRLNENASVDNLLKRATETTLDTFKKLVFDIASKTNRNPDTLRAMLLDIGSSQTVKGLIAKMKDYASEVELSDSRYSQVKQMYLTALGSIGDALKRLVEVDPNLGSMIIDNYKTISKKLIDSLDELAVNYSKTLAKNEAIKEYQNSEELNESIFTGYKGRIEKLRKNLVNLISDSKGKDAKSGYGRDWQRLFSALEQKLQVLETSKEITGEKDRKNLADLEKQTDNLAEEYYSYKIKATEQSMKKIVDDDELVTKFSDVIEMITKALDLIAKANVQEAIVETAIREELDEVESKITQKVFPIKIGSKDTDLKFKKSGLIAAVQKSLMEAFPSIQKFLSKHGGVDGKYGKATATAIKAIQSAMGNKNANGQLDKALLDSMMMMDQISKDNKKLVANSLETLKKSYAMSESAAISIADFTRMFEAVYLDDDDLQKELEKSAEDMANTPEVSTSEKAEGTDASVAKNLAKMLRTGGYNKNAEEEDFLKEDGTFKNSYPADFSQAWLDTLIANEGSADKPSFFWLQSPEEKVGALYSTKRLAGTVKKPYNWKKWADVSGSDSEDEKNNFAKWYTGYWSNFGGIPDEVRKNVISSVLQHYSDPKNSEDVPQNLVKDFNSFVSVFDDLKDILKSGKVSKDSEPYQYVAQGYLTSEAMTELEKLAKKSAQIDDKDPDLGFYEFLALSILVAVSGSCVAWDAQNKKWAPAFSILKRNVLSDEVIKRISEDKIFSSPSKSPIVKLSKEGAEIMEKGYDGNSKKVFMDNMTRAEKVLRTTVQKHADRMNLQSGEEIKGDDKKNIYLVPEA